MAENLTEMYREADSPEQARWFVEAVTRNGRDWQIEHIMTAMAALKERAEATGKSVMQLVMEDRNAAASGPVD